MTVSPSKYGKLAALTLLVGSTLGLAAYGAGAAPLGRVAAEALGRDIAAKSSVELAGYRRHRHHRRHRHYRRYRYGYGMPFIGFRFGHHHHHHFHGHGHHHH